MAESQLFQRSTFCDGMSQWFFTINVFASLQRCLADWYVPMVGRGDDDGIDTTFLFEKLTIIVVGSSASQSFDLQSTVTLPLVDIADRDDLLIDFCKFRDQVTPHLSPHSDAREGESRVRRLIGTNRGGQDRGKANSKGCGTLNKFTTRQPFAGLQNVTRIFENQKRVIKDLIPACQPCESFLLFPCRQDGFFQVDQVLTQSQIGIKKLNETGDFFTCRARVFFRIVANRID